MRSTNWTRVCTLFLLMSVLVAACSSRTPSSTNRTEVTAAAEATTASMAGADMRGAIDTGRILFVVESNGQAATLRVIEGDSMESVPLDDPDVARAKWAGGDSVVFDTAAPPDRQVFRVADYHKFDPIQLTDATDGDNLGRAVTGVSADGAHLLVGQWTVDPLAPSGPIELS